METCICTKKEFALKETGFVTANGWGGGERGEGGGHFGPFCPFTLLKNQKINNLNKGGKKPGDIAILHRCTKTHDHMLYCS